MFSRCLIPNPKSKKNTGTIAAYALTHLNSSEVALWYRSPERKRHSKITSQDCMTYAPNIIMASMFKVYSNNTYDI